MRILCCRSALCPVAQTCCLSNQLVCKGRLNLRNCSVRDCTKVSFSVVASSRMIGVGRKGLQESITRALSSCLIQTQPAQFLPSATAVGAACMHSNPLPYQQLSSMKRNFAATATEDYSPDGQMSAVTFHGPRTMKVSQKPKPRLETSGVSTSHMQ